MSATVSYPELVLDGVTVRFGGRTAVDAVDLCARAGVVTGLIGPNGAGKTTTFNAATGFLRPDEGSVRLGDLRLDGRSVAWRARHGLGRTFQRTELFDSSSVLDNVALGREARLAGRSPWAQLAAGRGQRGAIVRRAWDSLERCGIADLAHANAGALSTGQRRLVELARALAGDFSFLLLDEPSSGLDEEETERFGRIIADLAGSGTGVLLVEHDMTLVRAICSHVYVLDFGALILDGPTREVLASGTVRASYLGKQVT